jgi:hypothetical protein
VNGFSRRPQLFPARALFGAQVAVNPPAFASSNSKNPMEVAVLRKPKASYQPASEYNAYLAGWAVAFSALLLAFFLIASGIYF